MSLAQALAYFTQHNDKSIVILKELVQIPSISFPNFPTEPLVQSADLTAEWMKWAGLENVQLLEVEGAPPSVYGDWLHHPDAPTVLLYAHHDVQPSMREHLWESPPFEPTEIDGRLFGRGSADDKAGVVTHLMSIASWLHSSQQLPVNIRVWIDGEEEVGSPHLAQTLQAYPQLFQAQAVLIADLSHFDVNTPSLTTSLRGHITFEIELKSMQGPLHSGLWSGVIPDPTAQLCRILASLTDEKGHIQIPELLADLKAVTAEEIELWQKLPFDRKAFYTQSGLNPAIELADSELEILIRNWRRPTLTITSMEAGKRGETGNVILESAWARVGLRIAPGQNAQKMTDILSKYLMSVVPQGFELKLEVDHPAEAWISPKPHPYQQAALEAMSESWQKQAFPIGCGATIPLVQVFEENLDHPVMLLTGVEDPLSKAHAENESLHLSDFIKGIESQIRLFAKIGEIGN